MLGQFDQPNDRGNIGCRLFEDEIFIRMDNLRFHTWALFGPGVKLQWDGNIEDITDPQLFFERQRNADYFHHEVIHLGNYWQANTINIYFAGNIQEEKLHYPGDPEAIGLTGDPRFVNSTWPLTQGRAFIIVNDGGVNQSQGFVFDPSVTVQWNILEHEMAHFLGRFNGRTIRGRSWDNGEHYANCILHPNAPARLIMPGRWSDPASEQGEIWSRLQDGFWGVP